MVSGSAQREGRALTPRSVRSVSSPPSRGHDALDDVHAHAAPAGRRGLDPASRSPAWRAAPAAPRRSRDSRRPARAPPPPRSMPRPSSDEHELELGCWRGCCTQGSASALRGACRRRSRSSGGSMAWSTALRIRCTSAGKIRSPTALSSSASAGVELQAHAACRCRAQPADQQAEPAPAARPPAPSAPRMIAARRSSSCTP